MVLIHRSYLQDPCSFLQLRPYGFENFFLEFYGRCFTPGPSPSVSDTVWSKAISSISFATRTKLGSPPIYGHLNCRKTKEVCHKTCQGHDLAIYHHGLVRGLDIVGCFFRHFRSPYTGSKPATGPSNALKVLSAFRSSINWPRQLAYSSSSFTASTISCRICGVINFSTLALAG